jgi:hypothetical protein
MKEHTVNLTLRVTALIFAALLTSSAARADSGILPDPIITPGAVRTTDVHEICANGTRELRHWSRERDDFILHKYGLPPSPHSDYELDHLIPLGIGGSDADTNIWPEPRATIEPTWNAERKDQLEWALRALICGGALDVGTAQRAIADDWTEAWKTYVGGRPTRRSDDEKLEAQAHPAVRKMPMAQGDEPARHPERLRRWEAQGAQGDHRRWG